jgi:hypothetical protein
MTPDTQATWITSFAGVAGATIGALATFLAARHERRLGQYRARVVRLTKDIRAFKRLEMEYATALAATTGKTVEAIRRQYRKNLRGKGHEAPSDLTSESRLQRVEATVA